MGQGVLLTWRFLVRTSTWHTSCSSSFIAHLGAGACVSALCPLCLPALCPLCLPTPRWSFLLLLPFLPDPFLSQLSQLHFQGTPQSVSFASTDSTWWKPCLWFCLERLWLFCLLCSSHTTEPEKFSGNMHLSASFQSKLPRDSRVTPSQSPYKSGPNILLFFFFSFFPCS